MRTPVIGGRRFLFFVNELAALVLDESIGMGQGIWGAVMVIASTVTCKGFPFPSPQRCHSPWRKWFLVVSPQPSCPCATSR